MLKGKIKLLIVEDNPIMCDILENFFNMTEDITVCAKACDGEEALEKILAFHPDIVLLDIVMPKMDGLSVLQKLKQRYGKIPNKIIVVSALGQETITHEALALGASYYIIKPYNLEDLLQRVYLLSEENNPPHSLDFMNKEKDLDNAISKLIISLGIPTNMLSYQYILQAIKILWTIKNSFSIVKQVYAPIAESNQTTVECVESAIRKAIERAYIQRNEEFVRLMNFGGVKMEKRPTNSGFLTIIVEKLKLETP